MKKTFYLTIFIVIFTILSFSLNTAAFSAGHSNFSIEYDGLKIPFRTFSIFVLPREEIKFSIAEKDRDQTYQIELGGKIYESTSSFTWKAQAESGHYQAIIKEKNSNSSGSEIKINIFVLYPYEEKRDSI